MDIEMKLGIPAAQQRLLLDSKLLETCMAAAGVEATGQLLQLSAGHEGKLELLLYIRSAAVISALEAVKKDGHVLLHASEELKGDREVVMEAVKQNGLALEYASEELTGDWEVVMEAVKQDGHALCYASKGLKCDRGVVMEAVKQKGHALEYASEELRRDS